tara:strand:- start:537 stop:1040 length:504 start_codon:yes stop_codon:yes gene_type:complete
MAETNIKGYSAAQKLNRMAVDAIGGTPNIAEATYSDGDLMAEQETISNAVSVNGGTCILQSIVAIDTSDTGGAITLIISDGSLDYGTVGSAVNTTDANADNTFAIVEISNFTDIGGSKIGIKSNIGLCMKASSTTKDLYYGVINTSGGNIVIGTDEDILFRFGVVKD